MSSPDFVFHKRVFFRLTFGPAVSQEWGNARMHREKKIQICEVPVRETLLFFFFSCFCLASITPGVKGPAPRSPPHLHHVFESFLSSLRWKRPHQPTCYKIYELQFSSFITKHEIDLFTELTFVTSNMFLILNLFQIQTNQKTSEKPVKPGEFQCHPAGGATKTWRNGCYVVLL